MLPDLSYWDQYKLGRKLEIGLANYNSSFQEKKRKKVAGKGGPRRAGRRKELVIMNQ